MFPQTLLSTIINSTTQSIWNQKGEGIANVNTMPKVHRMPPLWSSAEAPQKSTALNSRKKIYSQIKSQGVAESIFTRWHSCCCSTLHAVFLPSSPLLLMLLIMIFHQQDRFGRPPQRPCFSSLISPQSPCGSPTVFTDCQHLLLLIISPVLNALLLLQSQCMSCMYTHTYAEPSEHNIIGQRFEIMASPSGERLFLQAAVNW